MTHKCHRVSGSVRAKVSIRVPTPIELAGGVSIQELAARLGQRSDGTGTGIRLVDPRCSAYGHARKRHKEDVVGRTVIHSVVQFTGALNECLPLRIRADLALVPDRLVDGDHALLYDDDRASGMRVPA